MTADLAHRLDATILKPEALSAEVHKVATLAMHTGCHGVVAAPVWTARLATMLRGSGVRILSAVSYPHGGSKPTLKAIEATSTIKDGADEIEISAHLAPVLSFDLDAARAELLEIVRAARSTRRDVVIATAYDLSMVAALDAVRLERIVEIACRATRESGCDGIVVPAPFIATARRFGESLTIKAAAVSDRAAARAALDDGADRVGALAAVLSEDHSA